MLPSIACIALFLILILCIVSIGYRSRSVLYTFIAIEILFLNIGLLLTVTSWIYDSYAGFAFAMCLLALSATEAGLGFALLIAFYKKSKTTDLRKIKTFFKD